MQTALITGANRGLGLETARQLAARGWHVLLASRDPDKGSQAASTIPGSSARTLDIADANSIRALARDLEREEVRLDVLVNNAAISMRGFNPGVAKTTIDVNLLATLSVTAALVPRVRDGGSIVMVSSGMGELSVLGEPARGRVEHAASIADVECLAHEFVAGVEANQHEAAGWPSSAYSVSKALLNAATRVLAHDFAPRGIRVNAVCPGWVRTDLGGPRAPRDVATGAASIVATILDATASGGFFRDGKRIPW